MRPPSKYSRRTRTKQEEANNSRLSANKLDCSVGSSTSQKQRKIDHRFMILTDNNSKQYKRDVANDESHLEEIRENNSKFLTKIHVETNSRHKDLTRIEKAKVIAEQKKVDKRKRFAEMKRELSRNEKRDKIKKNMEKIKEDKYERLEKSQDFDEFYKGWKDATPLYQRFEESYRETVVVPREKELKKVKEEKHTIFGPIDHDSIKTHNRSYMTRLAQNKMQIKEIAFPGSSFQKSDVYYKTLENDVKDGNSLVNRRAERQKLLNLQRTYASKVGSTNKSDIDKNMLNVRSRSPTGAESRKKISVLPKIVYDQEKARADYEYLQKRNNIGNDYLASLRKSNKDGNMV